MKYHLPIEIWISIIQFLDLRTTRTMKHTYREFSYLIDNISICTYDSIFHMV